MSDLLNNKQLLSKVPSTDRVLPKSMPANTLKKQAGASFIGIFCLVMMLAFVGLFAFKVVPSYIEFSTVSKIAEDAQANAELMKQPKSKVMASIGQAYRTNSIWDLKAADTITLTKDSRTGFKIEVAYEKRSNLFSNIYVVQAFNKVAGQP